MDNRIYATMSPKAVRLLIREEKITTQTSGMCDGYAQANLCILPKAYADDFLLFTRRNPLSCPVLEVSKVGARTLEKIASGADIAKDFPKYRIYRNGELTQECTNVEKYWREDLVSFFIGCSFSFEWALIEAGIPVRHIEEGKNVPMYRTSLPCQSAGIFHGNMVVSMRPMTPEQAKRATEITAGMSRVHGAPVHVGDPSRIGIADLSRPDFGDSVSVRAGEVPVFWPCGVTPQVAVMQAKPSFAITHAPGHMFITDIKNSELLD